MRQGVIDYLTQRSDLNLSRIKVDVTAVSFRENEADATVAFRPKDAAQGGMQMRYTLERKGDKWVVKGHGRSGGQSPHSAGPGSGQMPAGGAMGAPAGAEGGAGLKLPPGHPPMEGAPPSK